MEICFDVETTGFLLQKNQKSLTFRALLGFKESFKGMRLEQRIAY